MGLQSDVENRMGESVNKLMTRNAVAGKSVRHCSMLMLAIQRLTVGRINITLSLMQLTHFVNGVLNNV